MTATVSDRHLTGVARGGVINLVGGVGNGVLQLLIVVLVTRFYPQAISGVLLAVTSLFLVVVAGSSLGADTGMLRWVPYFVVHRRPAQLRRTMAWALVPVAVVAVLSALVVAALAGPLSRALVPSDPHDARVLITVLAVFLPFAALLDVLLAGTRGFGSMTPTLTIDKIGRAALQCLGVSLAALGGAGLASVAVGWGSPYVVAAAVAAVALRRRLRRAVTRMRNGHGSTAVRPAGGDAPDGAEAEIDSVGRVFWRYTWPRAVARFLQIALMRVDVILIGLWYGVEAAAVYGAATRLLVLGMVGVTAVQQILQPTLSHLLAAGDLTGARAVYRTSTAWTVAMAWPVYLSIAGLSPLLMRIFGPDYVDGAVPLSMLATIMLFATVTGAVDIVVLMSGRSLLSLGNMAAALTTDLALNALLIPRYGMFGAATSMVAATFVQNVLPLIQVRRILGSGPWSPELGHVVRGSLACFGVPLGLAALLGVTDAVRIAVLALGAAAYAVVLWRGREPLRLGLFLDLARRRGRGANAAGGPATDESEQATDPGPAAPPAGARMDSETTDPRLDPWTGGTRDRASTSSDGAP